ncbi:D-alanyl-D-alanine carboxypeptidase family protein [Peribacillus kribbensis]|uniref:D-alanyl-D-alanine carboxypeptidase family protein n=1 Tax=Peribacillus kribbensis TaxID=356658 RepID=UPI0004242E5F|nr:D-alanyl-D-alanine carboxypeptidase family protein [Peribacillus kribbensis]
MQKYISISAALLLASSILAGCGTQNQESSKPEEKAQSMGTPKKEAAKEETPKEESPKTSGTAPAQSSEEKKDSDTAALPDKQEEKQDDSQQESKSLPNKETSKQEDSLTVTPANKNNNDTSKENKTVPPKNEEPSAPASKPTGEVKTPVVKKPDIQVPSKPDPKKDPDGNEDQSIHLAAQPSSIQVLINKENKLPDGYVPGDLVYTNIPFIFSGNSEKKKMRKPASDAISRLFAGAKQQGMQLLGVSAYRSYVTQVGLFNAYVKKDGYEKARTYSAVPGTSEHQTGLTIDVTGGDGKCAAESCFGGTKEAKWLQEHAADYGFIIRYPEGKQSITGYKYEPWHLRYVGTAIARDVMGRGITLEEYFHAVPVNN